MTLLACNKDLNHHAQMDAEDENLHHPKSFLAAPIGGVLWRDADENIAYPQISHFPSAINEVDGLSVPPTEVDGDIYLLQLATVILDVDTIVFQSGTTVRITFNGSPDLSGIAVNDHARIRLATNASNIGTFIITAVNDGSDFIEITNTARTDGTDDEASDSPATTTTTDAAWDAVGDSDWVKHFAGEDTWFGVTPQVGATTFNEATESNNVFGATGWLEETTNIINKIRIGTIGFDSLTDARDAAVSGDTIYVPAPLNPDVNDLLTGIATDVNWFFEIGAGINYQTLSGANPTNAIFDDINNLGIKSKVSGFGTFIAREQLASFKGVVSTSDASTEVSFSGYESKTTGEGAIFWCQNGKLDIDLVRDIVGTGSGFVGGVECDVGVLTVRCRNITIESGYPVSAFLGGTVEAHVNDITSAEFETINIGTGSRVDIKYNTITNTGTTGTGSCISVRQDSILNAEGGDIINNNNAAHCIDLRNDATFVIKANIIKNLNGGGGVRFTYSSGATISGVIEATEIDGNTNSAVFTSIQSAGGILDVKINCQSIKGSQDVLLFGIDLLGKVTFTNCVIEQSDVTNSILRYTAGIDDTFETQFVGCELIGHTPDDVVKLVTEGVAHFRNTRITNDSVVAGSTCISKSNATDVIIDNVTLVCGGTESIAGATGVNGRLLVYGGCQANKIVDAGMSQDVDVVNIDSLVR